MLWLLQSICSNLLVSMLWRCWLGHTTRKIVSKMTCNQGNHLSGKPGNVREFDRRCYDCCKASTLTCWYQCYDAVGWVIQPVKSSPKWPIIRVTTCLENLAMSGNLTAIWCARLIWQVQTWLAVKFPNIARFSRQVVTLIIGHFGDDFTGCMTQPTAS